MPAAEPELAGDFESRLFRRLNALRPQIALEEDVPPHAVLHEFSLQEMTMNRPQTLDALAECHGVDAEKTGRNGKRLLAALSAAEGDPATSGDTREPEPRDLVPEPALSNGHDPGMFARLDAL